MPYITKISKKFGGKALCSFAIFVKKSKITISPPNI